MSTITLFILWICATQEEEKDELCRETGLLKKQINDWFVNTRKREWGKVRHYNCAGGRVSMCAFIIAGVE